MWINCIARLLDGERILALLALILSGVLVLSLMIAYFVNSTDLFVALSFFALGIACLLTSLYKCSSKGVRSFFFFFVGVIGGLCLLLYLGLLVKKKRRERKSRRQALARKIEYTLPDKDNGYVRDRLHTALQIQEQEENSPCHRTEISLRLGFAKGLIEKLKEVSLTVIERAELEELSDVLSVWGGKEDWTGKEIQAVNSIFMRLLKLSAKYEIVV